MSILTGPVDGGAEGAGRCDERSIACFSGLSQYMGVPPVVVPVTTLLPSAPPVYTGLGGPTNIGCAGWPSVANDEGGGFSRTTRRFFSGVVNPFGGGGEEECEPPAMAELPPTKPPPLGCVSSVSSEIACRSQRFLTAALSIFSEPELTVAGAFSLAGVVGREVDGDGSTVVGHLGCSSTCGWGEFCMINSSTFFATNSILPPSGVGVEDDDAAPGEGSSKFVFK